MLCQMFVCFLFLRFATINVVYTFQFYRCAECSNEHFFIQLISIDMFLAAWQHFTWFHFTAIFATHPPAAPQKHRTIVHKPFSSWRKENIWLYLVMFRIYTFQRNADVLRWNRTELIRHRHWNHEWNSALVIFCIYTHIVIFKKCSGIQLHVIWSTCGRGCCKPTQWSG